MQLIITKEDEYLELEDTVVIKANEFGFGKIILMYLFMSLRG